MLNDQYKVSFHFDWISYKFFDLFIDVERVLHMKWIWASIVQLLIVKMNTNWEHGSSKINFFLETSVSPFGPDRGKEIAKWSKKNRPFMYLKTV